MTRKKKKVIDCSFCITLKATGEFCNKCLLLIHENGECEEDIVTLPKCHDISALCYERHCCCFKGMDKCGICQKKQREDQLLFDEASEILAQSLRATEQEICKSIGEENTMKCQEKDHKDLFCQTEELTWPPPKNTIRASRYEVIGRKEITDEDIQFLERLIKKLKGEDNGNI